MFGSKSKLLAQQTQRAEAILHSFVDTLQEGDVIEVEYNFNQQSTLHIEGDDGYTPVTVGGYPHVGTVRIRGNSIDYGGKGWTAGLKFDDLYYTTAITNLRILERAGVKV